MNAMWEEKYPPDSVLHTRAIVRDAGALITLRSAIKGCELKMDKHLDDPTLQAGDWVAIFNVQATHDGEVIYLQRLPSTRLGKIHPQAVWDRFLEPCAGMGALSFGALEIGFSPNSACDISPLAVDTYKINHDAPCVLGNLLDGEDLWHLFEANGGLRVGMGTGFPCPPFSSMGDRRGFGDSRSLVFTQCLNIAYLFGCSFVVLECTPLTGQCAEVQDSLHSFAAANAMTLQTVVLNLQNSWPCRRTRWWATLLPSELLPHCRALRDLPVVRELQAILDVIPEWPQWTLADENALKWMQHEVESYHRYISNDQALLSMTGPCPTLLHSAGHHFPPCPCGCRDFPLAESRLEKAGVATVAVWMHDRSGLRRLHPFEAAYLSTIWPTIRLPSGDLRMTLPLIGQIAAPLQSHWIFGQVKEVFGRAGLLDFDDHCLNDLHMTFLDKLQRLRYHCWPLPSMNGPRELTVIDDYQNQIKIKIGPFAKVGHLLHAQRELEGWCSRVGLSYQDERLTDDCYLHCLVYRLHSAAPRQPSLLIPDDFPLRIRQGDQTLGLTVHSGDFLGLQLERVGIAHAGDPVLVSNALCWGDRIWQPIDDTFRGAGIHPDGLALDTLLPEIETLMDASPENYFLFPVRELAEIANKPRVVACFHIRRVLHRLCQEQGHAPHRIFFALCVDDHWTLITHDVPTNHTCTFDGLHQWPHSFHHTIAEICADFFGQAPVLFPPTSLIAQRDDPKCGVLLLVNLGWQCGLWTSFDYQAVDHWYDSLCTPLQVSGAGASDYATAHAFLVNFLPSRGVAAEAVAERAAQAIKKLGLNPILKAIGHENPWRQLKSIGSNASKPFQWVTSDELRLHISNRATQKYGADHSKRKPKLKDNKPLQPLPLHADGLVIPPSTFVDCDGKPLGFIALDDLKADCTGVTIATLEQVHRFLGDSKSLSTEALGMLTVQRIPDNHPGSLVIEHLTWPALFEDEPLLIRGSIVQLGDKHASLKRTPTKTTLVATSLLRFQVYRDQWTSDWQVFVQGPLKRLVQLFLPLQVCRLGKGASSCGSDCGRFNPPVDEPTELVLLDCFAWKWYTAEGKSTSPHHATAFSVMARAPASAVDAILALAGKEGFYPELREPKDSTPTYAVVWLKGNLADAQHQLQVQSHALYLTRLFLKYGLRCHKKHEEALRKALFPDSPFISCEVKLLFQVGPWPHGITKAAVQEAITGFAWTAKVLKPCKGNADGRFWLVGAPAAPATNVFQHGDSWITISTERDVPVQKESPTIVASLKTIQKINDFHQTSGQPDPWMQRDPWSTWKPSTAASSSGHQNSQPQMSRLDHIESTIKEAVAKQVKAYTPERDEDAPMSDAWKTQMETDIQELKLQNEKFHDWFNEAGSQMTQLQEGLQQQGHTIVELNKTVVLQTKTTSSLQTQFTQMETGLRQELRDFSQQQAERTQQQTEYLETLLAKRSRHE